MKNKSYTTVNIARINLVIFNPFDTDSVPLANENIPPSKSNIILTILQPFVLFLL